MAKRSNPGGMRTRVYVLQKREGEVADGYQETYWENVFGVGVAVWCRWINIHGAEAVSALQFKLTEPATLTFRYSPALTPTCRIRRADTGAEYEVLSVNDVEDRHIWQEVMVQRTVSAV